MQGSLKALGFKESGPKDPALCDEIKRLGTSAPCPFKNRSFKSKKALHLRNW